jgi:predicted nucleic acid-binding protein
MDAWIAATAIVHQAVCTQDTDFDAAHAAGLLALLRV